MRLRSSTKVWRTASGVSNQRFLKS
jgi:hypothetical protein